MDKLGNIINYTANLIVPGMLSEGGAAQKLLKLLESGKLIYTTLN